MQELLGKGMGLFWKNEQSLKSIPLNDNMFEYLRNHD